MKIIAFLAALAAINTSVVPRKHARIDQSHHVVSGFTEDVDSLFERIERSMAELEKVQDLLTASKAQHVDKNET